MDESSPRYYGELWADIYDVEHAFMDPTVAVAALADLAGGRRTLELGIGTGRIALPLAAQGVDVCGLDASEAMLAQLRSKPEGENLDVVVGDMADASLGGPYGLVFVAFNTFFGLMSQERQIACFGNVASALEPGGSFVLECFVPDVARFRDGNQTVRVVNFDAGGFRLNASVHDPAAQTIRTQVLGIRDDQMWARPVMLRYVWPSELDLMAQITGLTLAERWSGWDRRPYDGRATQHVSRYQRI